MSKIERARGSAKQWLKAVRTGDEAAIARLRRVLPDEAPETATLRTMQHALAREEGWPGWSAYKAYLTPAGETAPDLQEFLRAAECGDAAAVAAALDANPALLNQRGEAHPGNGLRTALHYGVHHAAVVRELLGRGADPNIRDQGDNAMPLHFAAERGNFEVVRLLIEHGADPVGAGTMHELDVLGWATVFGKADRDLVEYLLAHRAKHTLASAVAVGDVGALRALAKRGADQSLRLDEPRRGSSLLHLAVDKRQLAALAVLLEVGADLEATDGAGLTALDRAALHGEHAMAVMLEAAGARVGLPAAVGLGREGRVEVLLREEPSAVRPGGRWMRLIHRAAEHGTAAMIERLARAGASLWIEDDPEIAIDGTRKLTPLHLAAWYGNTDAARALIRLGAPVSPRDSRYCGTPAGWADYARHYETRDAILEGACDIWDAIAYDRRQRVAEILARDGGARTRRFGDYARCGPKPDERPLDRARELRRDEIARMLEDGGQDTRDDELAGDFLEFACWDNVTHGIHNQRRQDRAAQRLLEQHPEMARHSLYTAIVCGEVAEVRRRLETEPSLAGAAGGPRNWPPLLYLCFTRFTHAPSHAHAVEIGRLLLAHGADPNACYPAGDVAYSALVGVAAGGEQESPRQPQSEALYKLLLDHGAGPYDNQVVYNTHFYGDVLWWLELAYARAVALGRKQDWNDPDWPMFDVGRYGTGAAFLFQVADRTRNPALARWMESHGARRQARAEAATTKPRVERADEPSAAAALLGAARQNQTGEVMRLLDLGVSVNAAGRSGDRALHHAAIEDNVEMINLLLARGAEPDPVEQQYQSTPFGWACYREAQAAMERLLPLTHDVWALGFHGFVARLREVLDQAPERARGITPDGYTPLWWLPDDEGLAIEIAELFLAHGTDAAHRNREGHTAADWARKRGLLRLAARLGGA